MFNLLNLLGLCENFAAFGGKIKFFRSRVFNDFASQNR